MAAKLVRGAKTASTAGLHRSGGSACQCARGAGIRGRLGLGTGGLPGPATVPTVGGPPMAFVLVSSTSFHLMLASDTSGSLISGTRTCGSVAWHCRTHYMIRNLIGPGAIA